MTLVLQRNVASVTVSPPAMLSRRRRGRRVSTIVKRHAPAGRQFIVSVHRRGDLLSVPTDETIKMRSTWKSTIVGEGDVVVITRLPLGGGGGTGGGGSKMGIGLAIASVALIAIAPYAAPLLGLAAGSAGAIGVQAGLVVGGLALSYAASQANANNKKQKDPDAFTVTGGGNVPRAGQRKPLQYGRCWSAPPLSQPDFTMYSNFRDMALIKRLTLGTGIYFVHSIRIGSSTFWTPGEGIHAPFLGAGAAIELLYEQPSGLAPGDVLSSQDVAGQTLPRFGSATGGGSGDVSGGSGDPDDELTPWFRASPAGIVVDAIQIDFQWPGGLYHNSSNGQKPTAGNVYFQYRQIDPETGDVIGPVLELLNILRNLRSSTAIRETYIMPVAQGCYEVRGQNHTYEIADYQNAASWDGLRGIVSDVRIRPKTFEIVIKVPAAQGLAITSLSDVMVDASKAVEVWNGSAWVLQYTSKSVWAYADLVRNEYGLNLPDGVDQDRCRFYDLAEHVQGHDTYDGVLPEVSSFWEAAAEVLAPLRAEPVKIGRIHSFVRDESSLLPRHVIGRRQIKQSSAQLSYDFVQESGDGADVIVEFYRGGDPKRGDEVRYHFGVKTRTPKRYKMPGVVTGEAAYALARWLAAIAVYRGASRKVVVEWDGRLMYPGEHVLCDVWYIGGKRTYGIAYANGPINLVLDHATIGDEVGKWASIRNRAGREIGPVTVAAVSGKSIALSSAELQELGVYDVTGVLAEEWQDPSSLVVGTPVEMQETFVIRSVMPQDGDYIQIEMVRDDIRVWQLLGETVNAPGPPLAFDLEDPLRPVIEVLHAFCDATETDIQVRWSFASPRGGRTYEVALSYDGETFETISFGPAIEGVGPIRQSDEPITVQARAYGRTGEAGPWIATSFVTFPPTVDGQWVRDLSIGLNKLFAQVRHDIERISAIGLALVERGKGTIFDEMRKLESKIEELANAIATEAGDSYTHTDLVKVVAQGRAQEVFGALQEEVQIRASQVEVLVGQQTVLGARISTAENTIVGQGVAIDGLQISVTAVDGRVTVVSSRTTSLEATVNDSSTGVTATAVAVTQLTARVTYAEGSITSTAESLTALYATVNNPSTGLSATAIAVSSLNATVSYQGGVLSSVASQTTALQTTQDGHTTTLTAYGASINGVRAEWGVTWAYDGRAAGGIVLTGMRKLDGSFSTVFGVLGDLVVTGTISGDKLQANSIITNTLQVNDLILGNRHINYNQINVPYANQATARGSIGPTGTWIDVAAVGVAGGNGSYAFVAYMLAVGLYQVGSGNLSYVKARLVRDSDGYAPFGEWFVDFSITNSAGDVTFQGGALGGVGYKSSGAFVVLADVPGSEAYRLQIAHMPQAGSGNVAFWQPPTQVICEVRYR